MEGASSSCEKWGIWCGVFVVLSVAAELIIAWCDPPYETFLKLSVWPDAVIGIGIIGEVLFGMRNSRIQTELRARSNDKLGAAEKEAAEANARAKESLQRSEEEHHARVKLEMNLQPRSVSPEQFLFIQDLKDRFEAVNIGSESDGETLWFARQLEDAFLRAGIAVAMFKRSVDEHSFSTRIYEPNGFDGGRARTVEPLVDIFHMSEIRPALVVITSMPTDIQAPTNIPMIILGGRFVLQPTWFPDLSRAKSFPSTGAEG